MDLPNAGAGVNGDDAERDLPLKNAVEAVLFVSPDPLPLKKLGRIVGASPDELKAVIAELRAEYEGRGVELAFVAGGYRFFSRPEYASWAKQVLPVEKAPRLSRAALETLAIVAYRQPVTRVQIEEIRGVNSDAVLKTLTDRKLVVTDGREDVPGRPFRYRTTKQFLHYFGLTGLNDLPPLEVSSEEE
ncbi:MAG: SMC-Scp complex subunit ScpB [Candidatus Coatesbacteria bacterium]|nr:MAG: SMC-Scp complex subunit ScpB [Candidatus Coatesbacteria bacterium]